MLLSCEHGTECGACALLEREYDAQLRLKWSRLGGTMNRYDSLKRVQLRHTLPSPLAAGYRNRAKMAVGMSPKGGFRLGYFRHGTREIVDAPGCQVLLPELLETTRGLRRFLKETRGIPKSLRHIDLRCGSDPRKQHLILVFRDDKPPKFPLMRLLKACPMIDGVSRHCNPSAGPQVIRGTIEPVWGEREIWVDSDEGRLRVSPGSFFQVNLGMLPAIHGLLGQFMTGGPTLVDLYAGVGTHGLALGRKYRKVLFVEGTRSAVADLKATLAAQRIHTGGPHDGPAGPGGGPGAPNAQVIGTAVERALPRILDARPSDVILNPSRQGVLPRVLDALIDSSAERLAYLSCEPRTLTRDLDHLTKGGFQVQEIVPIDMMPQTLQIEALALVRRVKRTERRPAGPAGRERRGPGGKGPGGRGPGSGGGRGRRS